MKAPAIEDRRRGDTASRPLNDWPAQMVLPESVNLVEVTVDEPGDAPEGRARGWMPVMGRLPGGGHGASVC
jgi:hypothetical protein